MQAKELDRVLTAQAKKGQITQYVNDGMSLEQICTSLLNERDVTTGAPSGKAPVGRGDSAGVADEALTIAASLMGRSPFLSPIAVRIRLLFLSYVRPSPFSFSVPSLSFVLFGKSSIFTLFCVFFFFLLKTRALIRRALFATRRTEHHRNAKGPMPPSDRSPLVSRTT